VYHGDRARYHYFQCLQLVLRHQIKALVDLWKLPPEFEVRPSSWDFRILIDSSQIICRDTWALHLSTLPHAISPEPLLHKQDGEPEPSSPTKRSSERGLTRSRRSHDVEDEGSDSESIASSSSEGEEEDPELEALLEQLSASSEDDDPTLSPVPIKQAQTSRKDRGVYELPANNIAVLILACWTLRIPITVRDFTKWVIDLNLRVSRANSKP
jgi:RNA polymerase I-specific transcription initiation factor RRN7